MIAEDRISPATSARPSTPRTLVVLTAVAWLIFASQFPYSLDGLGILVLLALIALDIALGITTGWLAFMPTSRLDERQAGVRDRAYRVGFRLVGTSVVLMVLLGIAGNIASFYVVGPPVQSVATGFSPRAIVAVLELLVIAPTVVIAWMMPAEADSAIGQFVRWAPLVAVPTVGLLWVVTMVLSPIQSAPATRVPDTGFGMGDATCGHFSAVKEVAAGFGGIARLEATVCWNHQQAFTVGDISLPRPASIHPEEWPSLSRESWLTTCAPLNTDADFGSISEQCIGHIDADGTLHLTMLARIAPMPGSLASREVRADLVVTRDGKVVTFR